MKTHLLNWLSEIGSSYWFVPTILTVGAIALASVMVQLDGAISPQDLPALPGLSNLVQASGARELLATVAGSIITVTSLVFSLTMVVLQMASQQFGSRLVGNFMRDRTNQWVLGLFLATFAYCLWVLRTVRAEVESTGTSVEGITTDAFVPHLSILVALALTLLTLFVLIYFIHHTAQSIQVEFVLSRLSDDLKKLLKNEAPQSDETLGSDGDEAAPVGAREPRVNGWVPGGDGAGIATEDAVAVSSPAAGYLQAINGSGLAKEAADEQGYVRVLRQAGEFCLRGEPLALVAPSAAAASLSKLVVRHVVIGRGRTRRQDPAFMLDQLVEVALRALSAGVNDPYTAVACIDRLTDGFLLLSSSPKPVRAWRDDDGELRVVSPQLDVAQLARRLFGSLRGAGAADLQVATHLAQAMRRLQTLSEDEALNLVLDDEVSNLIESAERELLAADVVRVREAAAQRHSVSRRVG